MIRTVPSTGSEKEILYSALDRHRDVVRWKLEGLDDGQLRRPMTPSGTSMLGLLKHLAAVEYGWFCQTFGRPTEARIDALDARYETDPDADLRVEPEESTADLLAFYARARAAADLAIQETDLDTTGTSWAGRTVSMRWVLVHMVEEVARHAGHLDILRELIDGATGDHPEIQAPAGS
ncbi:DinB family protein [Streptacidiphilus sp. N1-12]|uniref:DinB family protein n=2 Tax=Streptacidiphilus alkalitolerans TaxID=3342712 RepID=A0ABV6WQN2_9ACTN